MFLTNGWCDLNCFLHAIWQQKSFEQLPFIVVCAFLSSSEKHFLRYTYTVLTKDTLPVFNAVCESDDRLISHYSIKDQVWIRENLTVDDWNEAPEPPETRDWFLNYLPKCQNHAECSGECVFFSYQHLISL